MNFTSDKGLAIFSQRNGVRGGYTLVLNSRIGLTLGEKTGYTDVLISSKFI